MLCSIGYFLDDQFYNHLFLNPLINILCKFTNGNLYFKRAVLQIVVGGSNHVFPHFKPFLELAKSAASP